MNNPKYLCKNPNEVNKQDQFEQVLDFHFDDSKMMAKFNSKKQKRIVLNLDEGSDENQEDINTKLEENHL